ncbi:uncharacterized protein IWZ02DRAFT_81521 [Phyllosticta citriasiana]|uniref:Uncharacterized protein n=1 Tax=Phyllosticta citriasiana TaxID=595635 RepID=A0ABR1KIX7_9PEZI
MRSNIISPVNALPHPLSSNYPGSSPSRRRLDGIHNNLDDHDHGVTQRRSVLLLDSLLRPRILSAPPTPSVPPVLAPPPLLLLAASVVAVVFAVHGGRGGRNVGSQALVLDVVRVRCGISAVELELLVLMSLVDRGGSGRRSRACTAVCCRRWRRRMCKGGWMVFCLHGGSAHWTSAVFVGHRARHGGFCTWKCRCRLRNVVENGLIVAMAYGELVLAMM